MLTKHSDKLEIFLLDGDLQIWTKVGDLRSRIERDRFGEIQTFCDTGVEYVDEYCLTDQEIQDVLEVIHNYLLSKRT